MSLKSLLKRPLVGGSLLAAAVVYGSFMGNAPESIPFIYHKKTGTSVGISLALVNELGPGAKHYGFLLGAENRNGGELYGVSLGLDNEGAGGVTNGMELGVFNSESFRRDRSVTNSSTVNGLQVGLINSAAPGMMLQVGLFNSIRKSEHCYDTLPLMNGSFE